MNDSTNPTPSTDWDTAEAPHAHKVTNAISEAIKDLGSIRALNIILNVLFAIEIQMPREVMERAREAYAKKVIQWREQQGKE